jgi:hypothetical protein
MNKEELINKILEESYRRKKIIDKKYKIKLKKLKVQQDICAYWIDKISKILFGNINA